MSEPANSPVSRYSFPCYLAAKKSVDDRALNRHVWSTLTQALPGTRAEAPLRVLEIGCGIGTMLERMLSWGLLHFAEYTGLDAQAENIAHARQRLPEWATGQGYQVTTRAEKRLVLEHGRGCVAVHLEASDLFDFIARQRGQRRWDLLVAHAFLDLMDIPTTLPRLFELGAKGSLFYFTINFDGVTLFEPVIDPGLDEHIQVLYHRTMDARLVNGEPSGDSRAGRHLFAHLRSAGAHILDVGASDWVVFAGPAGYTQDEAYFLQFILHTVHQALSGNPALEPKLFAAWVAQRLAQVQRGELVYIAHQLDFVGRFPDLAVG